MSAKTLADLADSDLVAMLRFAMLHEGVKPFSTADNILADLRERIAKREAQGRA
jgi:transcriptional regulator NrdR family protein